MGALAGFVLGYYLGMKQGPEGYAKLRQALDTILASPEARALLERLPFLHGGGGKSNGAARGEAGDGAPLAGILRALADSEALQSLLAGGLELARGLLVRKARA